MTSPVASLQDIMRGRVILPGEPGWDDARAAWNLSADQRPSAVVQAADADDIAAVLRAGCRVAPQATGHGAEALGPLDETVLLKTSGLSGVSVDPGARLARVEAGVRAADAAAAAAAHGLAPVLGFAGTVGVVGLTLSGGTGWLSRRHGLAASNALAFDVVLASGERRRVDADSERDLFWALRGGGGRGAVVTAVELALHPLSAVSGGMLAWPAEQTAEVLAAFRALTGAPHALGAAFRYLELPPLEMIPPPLRGRRIATVIAAYLGEHDEAADLVAPLRAIPGSLVDTFAPIGPADLVRIAGDPEMPIPSRGDGFLLRELTEEAATLVAERAAGGALAPLSVLELRLLGGATSEPHGDDGGALSGFAASHSVFAGGAAHAPEATAATLARLGQVRADLAPWAADQVILSAATTDRDPARAFGSAGWDRLQRVLDTYDPERRIVGGALG
jgi:FAD/FMN-containing dehydrogenase